MTDDRIAGTFARQLPRPDASAITRYYLARWVGFVRCRANDRRRRQRRARSARPDGAAGSLHLRQRLLVHPAIDLESAPVPPDADRGRHRVGGRSAAGGLPARVRPGGGRHPFARPIGALRVRPDVLLHRRLYELFELRTIPTLPLLARAIASSLLLHLRCQTQDSRLSRQLASDRAGVRVAARAVPRCVVGGQRLEALPLENGLMIILV